MDMNTDHTPQRENAAKLNGGSRERREVMRVLAHADLTDIKSAMIALSSIPEHLDLRAPEIGLVMLRGRIGGDGSAFNIGEATVTRAAIRLESGEIGHAYVLGRSQEKARKAALIDAMWQSKRYKDEVEVRVITPLRQSQACRHATLASQTAATKVDFFTLARGEDA